MSDTLAQLPMVWEERAAERMRLDIFPRLPGNGSLTMMFPAYNDAKTIGSLIDWSARVLVRVATDYEIVVVNDGSQDETAAVLADRAATYPFLKVITHDPNQGYGMALRSGFAAATKDFVFYTDGDGQYDPTEVISLIPDMAQNAMVNGFKIRRGDNWVRLVVGRVYHYTARFLFSLPIRDTDCDFRLMARPVLNSLTLTSHDGSICPELVWQMKNSKLPIVEVPVHHYPRVSGKSQFFKPWRVFRSLAKLVDLWRRLVLWRFGGRILRQLGLRK